MLLGVYNFNNTKATFLRDLEIQNLTSQNIFNKPESDDRFAFKTASYTKLESDTRYAQIGQAGDDNSAAYRRNESAFFVFFISSDY